MRDSGFKESLTIIKDVLIDEVLYIQELQEPIFNTRERR